MRVPLNFDHPLHEVWTGYINPYYEQREECTPCKGRGDSERGHELSDLWYGWHSNLWVSTGPNRRYNAGAWQYNLDVDDVAALLKADRLWDFTRVHDPSQPGKTARPVDPERQWPNGWLRESNGHVPTPEEVNHWARHNPMFHDSINCWTVIRARLIREGADEWCRCCAGNGEHWPSMRVKMLYDTWESSDPPEGPGFQLWETTTEGSPISPVFITLWELCQWAYYNANTFADYRASPQDWYRMLNADNVHAQVGNSIFI